MTYRHSNFLFRSNRIHSFRCSFFHFFNGSPIAIDHIGGALKYTFFTAILSLFVSACGGFKAQDAMISNTPDVSSLDSVTKEAEIVGAGQLKTSVNLKSLTSLEFQDKWGVHSDWALQIRNNVKVYRIEYLTPNAQGDLIQASGIIAVPDRSPQEKSKPLPLLSYQHGTIFRNSEAPSQAISADQAPLVLASMGFAVVAADYIGFGSTLGTPHPYLQSSIAATTTVDLISAAKTWLSQNNFKQNGQLFLMGYSQGAHVSMAAHKLLQNLQSARLSTPVLMIGGGGPYSVQATMDGVLQRIRNAEPLLASLIQPGVLRLLGGSLRERIRNEIVKKIIPSNSDISLDPKVLDLFLADDEQGLNQLSNVHNWIPEVPVHLFHGIDDETVSYSSSLQTIQTMQQLSNGNAPVSLTNCEAQATSHLGCVGPFFKFSFQTLFNAARDL